MVPSKRSHIATEAFPSYGTPCSCAIFSNTKPPWLPNNPVGLAFQACRLPREPVFVRAPLSASFAHFFFFLDRVQNPATNTGPRVVNPVRAPSQPFVVAKRRCETKLSPRTFVCPFFGFLKHSRVLYGYIKDRGTQTSARFSLSTVA